MNIIHAILFFPSLALDSPKKDSRFGGPCHSKTHPDQLAVLQISLGF